MWSHATLADPDLPGVIVPTLVIGRNAWDMMHTYVQDVGPTEINGFGYVTTTSNGDFYWGTSDDVLITPQTVTMGTADVSSSEFAKLVHRSMIDEREDDLRLQWHSHVWGDAYHSATDMESIEQFGRGGMTWFISVVTNKSGNITARLDMYRPLRVGIPMRVVIVQSVDPTMSERALDDIARMVKVEKPRNKPASAAPAVLAPSATN